MCGFIQTRQGPILCQVKHRPDFKQALSTLQQLKQNKELYKRPRTLAEINNGHRVLFLLHGEVGKVLGGLLIPMKVTMEMNQVLTEGVTCYTSIWNNSSGHDFLEFIYFVTEGSFTAGVGLL